MTAGIVEELLGNGHGCHHLNDSLAIVFKFYNQLVVATERKAFLITMGMSTVNSIKLSAGVVIHCWPLV